MSKLEEFEIICKKCKSKNTDVISEDGYYYSEYTSAGGSLVIKCIDCGNAWSFYG